MKEFMYKDHRRNLILDALGSLLGYGKCSCGKNAWYANMNNPGIIGHIWGDGASTSKLLCNECYTRSQDIIDEHNQGMWTEYWRKEQKGRQRE